MNKILHGDSLELLKDLDDNSVDSLVTDPPYGYGFMGKDWDTFEKKKPTKSQAVSWMNPGMNKSTYGMREFYVPLWKEALRVLKPGSFAFIMSAPRADVQSCMINTLEEAGFDVGFTPVYWTYATGFPKAANMGKMIDKRLGKKGKVVGKKECGYQVSISKTRKEQGYRPNETNATKEVDITTPSSDEGKKMNGSYAGYQPKPAVEVVIVAMKPLSEKSFLDQAMKNGKGVTWLDDCRIPFEGMNDYKQFEKDNVAGHRNFIDKEKEEMYEGGWKKPSRTKKDEEGLSRGIQASRKKSDYDKYVEKQKSFKGAKTIGKVKDGKTSFLSGDIEQLDTSENYQKLPKTTKRQPREEGTVFKTSGFKSENNDTAEASPFGRFSANLLVQDDVLNDGKMRKATPHGGDGKPLDTRGMGWGFKRLPSDISDEGSFSRYYSLDSWWESRIQKLPLNVQATYPFLIVPKASKGEKDMGLNDMEKRNGGNYVFRNPEDTGRNDTEGQSQMGGYTKKRMNFHPTVKPISLMSYLVTLGSRKGDVILDPFVGSGTTCISAKLLSRKYIGMEKDDEYVVIAQERIKSYEPEEKEHDFF